MRKNNFTEVKFHLLRPELAKSHILSIGNDNV